MPYISLLDNLKTNQRPYIMKIILFLKTNFVAKCLHVSVSSFALKNPRGVKMTPSGFFGITRERKKIFQRNFSYF